MTIDIGNPAIDRTFGLTNATHVDKNVPADGDGKITSVEIWADAVMTGVKVATFYVVSGNYLSTRDTEIIGNAVAGYSIHAVDLNVLVGDYIGIYYDFLGKISYNAPSCDGRWFDVGDRIPCTNFLFSLSADRMISLHGIGEAPPVFGDSARTGIYSFKTLT